MIEVIFLQALILLIWFNTEAFETYFKYIPFDIFKLKSYYKAKSKDITLDYIHYLIYNHSCFFVKLITCPICLNVWLSILSCLIFANIIYVPTVCLLSLALYLVIKKLI